MRWRVVPIYGYGWYSADGSRFDVPPEFSIEVSIIEHGSPFNTAVGVVDELDHPLRGLCVQLTQRTQGAQPTYNLRAFKTQTDTITPAATPIVTGFAMVSELSN